MAKLNVQGLARRDKEFMSCILAEPGTTLVSVDLSAGEPTCTAHYSRDKNYYDATFGMVGKAPYYDGDLLKISDIYLTGMSVSPMAQKRLYEVVHTTYDGETFAERWLKDPEYFQKNVLKKERALHKRLILGIGYSMGPRKLVKSAYEDGHILPLATSRQFFDNYWRTFADVRSLGKRLERAFERDGHLINDFGYRLVPDAPYKALNYFIQSSVSGIMNVLSEKFFALCPEAKFVTVIHDELIFEIADDLVDYAQVCMRNAEESLNTDLNWSVRIRTGWAPGKNWYEAK